MEKTLSFLMFVIVHSCIFANNLFKCIIGGKINGMSKMREGGDNILSVRDYIHLL